MRDLWPADRGVDCMIAALAGGHRAKPFSILSPASIYQLLADAVLALHFAIVVFVVTGLVFIVAGGLRGWRLARSPVFRWIHLGAIAVVVAQAWLGRACPLTTLEMWLRARSRARTYPGSFIEHWVGRLLYWDAPVWVFTLAYSVFGLIVLAAWWYFPPRRDGQRTPR